LGFLKGSPYVANKVYTKEKPMRRYDSCYYEIQNAATKSQIGLLNKTSGEEGGARIYI